MLPGHLESGIAVAQATNRTKKLNPIHECGRLNRASGRGEPERRREESRRGTVFFGMSATRFHRASRLRDGGERGMPSIAVKR